jgi:hypothetical protein
LSSWLALLKALAGHAQEDRHGKEGRGEERRHAKRESEAERKVMDHADVGQRERVYFSVKRRRKRRRKRRKKKEEVMGATS